MAQFPKNGRLHVPYVDSRGVKLNHYQKILELSLGAYPPPLFEVTVALRSSDAAVVTPVALDASNLGASRFVANTRESLYPEVLGNSVTIGDGNKAVFTFVLTNMNPGREPIIAFVGHGKFILPKTLEININGEGWFSWQDVRLRNIVLKVPNDKMKTLRREGWTPSGISCEICGEEMLQDHSRENHYCAHWDARLQEAQSFPILPTNFIDGRFLFRMRNGATWITS